jgi:hypothetical protein
VLVFVRPSCPACETLLTHVLASRAKLAGIDIFIADAFVSVFITTWCQYDSVMVS